MATSNANAKRTIVSLPNEIITEEIFPKLPADSLVRFKCVSKSYNALISSPEFIDLHLRQSQSSDANCLLILISKFDSDLYSIDVDSIDSVTTTTKIPVPRFLYWLASDVSVVGSINGLLCVEKQVPTHKGQEYELVVFNPSTRVYRPIPSEPSQRLPGYVSVSFGFGFDDINHVYKLVVIAENYTTSDFEVGDDFYRREITLFNLDDNSWKLVHYKQLDENSDSLERKQHGVSIRNYLHWVFLTSDSKYRICCFDVRFDKWEFDVPLMDLFYDINDRNTKVQSLNLGVLDGCLCVSTLKKLSRAVWVMKEYGVKESWVKLFEISQSYNYFMYHRDFPWYGPIGFRRGSKHEVLVRQEGKSGLYWYDIGSRNYSGIKEIKEIPLLEEVCFFKGSLVPVPGGVKIEALEQRRARV